ncbi:MAG: sulfatase-like hydrolase/transferase [Gammaproteobacteria bacterium]|nr:sulfatase-like hydrolase/transferase [Gammaproteobacteria bacterium]
MDKNNRKPDRKQPNLILILADDMGFSDIGCFGGEIETPNLDKLGFDGIRFSQLYNSSRCCPTRASLLTGLSPHQAGVGHMVDDWRVDPAYQGWLREDTVTIAEALKTGGYRTFYSGKWHVNWSFEPEVGLPGNTHHHKLGDPGYPHPLQRGFDRSYALMAGATSLFNPQHLLEQDQWIEPQQPDYYITDVITDKAIEMINEHVGSDPIDRDYLGSGGSAPFFLHLSHIAPHWPLQALPEDIEKYRNYYQKGWDRLRRDRHEKLQELGLIHSQWKCSERDEYAPP